MGLGEVERDLDRATKFLSTQAISTALDALKESIEILHPIASESTNGELAEAFEVWRQSVEDLERIQQICIELKKLIVDYKAKILNKDRSPSDGCGIQDQEPRDVTPKNKAVIDPRKFRYFFGESNSNKHNKDRSQQNLSELNSIRIFNNPGGCETLGRHLEQVVSTDSNIKETFSNEHGEFQIRDSLLAGPGGFLQLETTWHVTSQGLRLTTMIPKRGKK
ncbi:hypothetical protein LZ318_35170 [Saccharopolyspora indica]|uniref:hypothetical protein n=1 Tax=Saccharopolyspora indica TaxID=1229659 RepID=UPI0022EAA8F9|nr:hypothetical protein [Saccharopolyspora indica]MDA3649828.1 hypothetical protein [Saccharopolyspora indica]